jgi:outer membrane protein OmpA-like peptidoglycan-associated protein
MKKLYTLIIILSVCFTAFSQSFDKGKFREKFADANYHVEYQNYVLAIPIFKELLEMDPENANINFKIGFCYLKANRNKPEALSYLEKAVKNVSRNYDDLNPFEKTAPNGAYYYLAQAYHLNYQLDEAIAMFNKFKETINKKHLLYISADRHINMCNNAKEFIANKLDFEIQNLMGNINTEYPEYSAVVSLDESTMIFTSRRPGGYGGLTEVDGQYYEDIYISHKDESGNWGEAKPIGSPINTADHEASIGLSADGQTLFIYKGDEGGSIWMSELNGEQWSSPIKLDFDVNSPQWETHAVISSDNRVIYFTSDRPGGFGGRDIWMCKRLPNGQWARAQNLGPTINTSYDEDAPFIHPDGKTIFFSSNGHKTMGGFDIFFAEIQEDGRWTTPINMGYPINTTDDDVYFVTSADGKRAYFSSDRKGGLGEKDIYMISVDSVVVEPIAVLKGILTLDGAEQIPPGILIFVTDIETGLVVNEVRPNSRTGKYTLALTPGKSYSISYEADGFEPIYDVIEIEDGLGYNEIDMELMLKPINFESKAAGTISLSGSIKNKEEQIIPGVRIIVVDNATSEEVGVFYTMADTSKYYFVLDLGQNYNVSFEAEGYMFHSENINIPLKPEFKEIKKNITLERIEAGTKIVLNNIFFDLNKSTLRKESSLELEKLYKVLFDYPEMKIEVGGHTDSKGNAELNRKLSQERAQSVVDHLAKKGIEKSRIVAKGYGKDLPIAQDYLPDGKPNEEGMQMNRRVEFKILDYNKPNKDQGIQQSSNEEGNIYDPRKDIKTKEVNYTTKGSLWGVQLGAYQKALPSNDFNNVKNVHSFIDHDGMVRYVIGSFALRTQAETLKKVVIEAGYKDAFIVDVNKEKKFSSEVVHDKKPKPSGKVIYSVQVGAYSTSISMEAAKQLLEIENIIEIPQGELMLLTVGSFDNQQSAEKLKEELIGQGFKDAFVIALINGRKISLQEAKEYESK